MKKSWYLPFVLEGLLAAAVFRNCPGDGTLLGAMAQPLALLGRGLRGLSLSGTAGNIAAWAVYLALCLAPLGWLGWKLVRGKARGEDALLVLLAGVLAWGLYYLINPTRLPGAWGGTDMGVYQCSQIVWSALLCWGLLALLRMKQPERALRWLLNVLGAVLVLSVCGLELGRLILKLEEVRKANTMGSLTVTNGFLMLRYGFLLLNGAFDLWVIQAGQSLLSQVCRDAYAQESVDAAFVLIRRGTLALKTAVLGSLGLNLLQILAGEKLRDVALNVNVPLSSMVLIFSGILLCRLLTRGRELQEDSKLII